jgi:hypothetical protein
MSVSFLFDDPRYFGDVDRIVEEFEQSSGCNVTEPARIIIKQGLRSVTEDEHMLLGASPELRDAVIDRVIGVLPQFLEFLRTVPRRVPTSARGTAGLVIGEEHATISGLMVLQNTQQLAFLSNCPCWPR